MKKLLILFFVATMAVISVDLNAMNQSATLASSEALTPKIWANLLKDPTFIAQQAAMLKALQQSKETTDSPGFIKQEFIKLVSELTTYVAKYALFIVTIYAIATYINLPAVQAFILDVVATFAKNLGVAGANVVATVVTGTSKGVLEFAGSNPGLSASAAGILSVLFWGPVAVCKAGAGLVTFMARHMVRLG